MDPNYHNYNYYDNTYTVPTAFGRDSGFHVQDLAVYGNYDVSGQYMQRSTSRISNSTTSYESVLEATQSDVLDYTNSYDYSQLQSPASATSTVYFPTLSQAGSFGNDSLSTSDYQQMTIDSPQIMQPTSVETGKRAEWVCLSNGCRQKPFKRCADLTRHQKHVHGSHEHKDNFYCDYRKCSRSKEYVHEARERGVSPTATGIGAFHRKDHFMAHLRDYHREPLPKGGSIKKDPGWLDGRIVNEGWWRCGKCLARVSHKKYGFTCRECGTCLDAEMMVALEPRMKEARQHRRSTGDGGRGHSSSRR